jgi:hypothetical protein
MGPRNTGAGRIAAEQNGPGESNAVALGTMRLVGVELYVEMLYDSNVTC